jgi:signal recognition particle GTPase
MTPQERANPDIINPPAAPHRAGAAAGRNVNRVLTQHNHDAKNGQTFSAGRQEQVPQMAMNRQRQF